MLLHFSRGMKKIRVLLYFYYLNFLKGDVYIKIQTSCKNEILLNNKGVLYSSAAKHCVLHI